MGTQPSKPTDPITATLLSDPTLDPTSFPNPTGQTTPIPHTTRQLGYAIYGDSAAPPPRTILFMHGTPGTRFFFTQAHSDLAASHNIRVLVPERPGYGLSTPDPTRTLLSTARDLAVVLDAEDIEAAHVIGYSAGGPFALAFAHELPERCLSVALVSSLSPNAAGVTRGMTVVSKVGYWLARRMPGVLTWVVRGMVGGALGEVFEGRRSDFIDSENEFFGKDEGVRRCFVKSTLELYSRESGARAEAEDYVLMGGEWGFEVGGVGEVEVFLYGGGRDNKCTVGMFEVLERGLREGGCLLKVVELEGGEDHLMFYRVFERVLTDLGLIG